MEIRDKIEYLHRIITGVKKGDTVSMGMFDRMFAMGVITVFNDINRLLEKEVSQLDLELNLNTVSINFDKYLNRKEWTNNWLYTDFEKIFKENGVPFSQGRSHTTEINQMMDYFPNGIDGYFFTPDTMQSLRVAMHQLTDGDKLAERDVFYALNAGLDRMLSLMEEVRNKISHPKGHLFTKLWSEIYEIFDNDECCDEYEEWKDENPDFDFDELKSKQKQEIYTLLKNNFFRFYSNPIGAEVRKCILKITSDDLPVGTDIPENLDVECAKFARFFQWKGEHILSLDYEKLGQYIYKNYHKFDEHEFFYITDFDRKLDAIHKDMACKKPKLKPYLKDYKEQIANELLEECATILNTCQQFLAKDIRPTFLEDYLRKLLFDKDMRDEARKKLSGGSRNTYICEMVAALKNARVFKVDCDKNDLANSIGEKITTVQVANLAKYIERSYNDNEGALNRWTKKVIDDLKQEPNIFEGII